MDKAIQNCFDICPSSKRLGTGAVQSRAIYNVRTEEVKINSSTDCNKDELVGKIPKITSSTGTCIQHRRVVKMLLLQWTFWKICHGIGYKLRRQQETCKMQLVDAMEV